MPPPEHPLHERYLSEDYEEDLRAAIDALVMAVTWVGQEISVLKSFITAQNASNLPPYLWEPYTGYNSISVMIRRLDEAVADLRDHVTKTHFSRRPVYTQIAQARAVSTNISNAFVYMMQIMNEKMDSIVEVAFDESVDSELNRVATCAFQTNMFVKETRNLVKHTSSAAESVWAALDMLQVVPSIAVPQIPYDEEQWEPAKPWTWKEWMVVMFGILIIAACINNPHPDIDTIESIQPDNNTDSSTLPPDIIKFLNDVSTRSNAPSPVSQDMRGLHRIINETLTLDMHVQDTWLEELQQRDQRIMEAIQHTNERLDNMWEALGPPNENGTYMTAYQHDTVIDKRFDEIMEAQQFQDEKNKAKLLELKRQLQLFEVRAGSRLSHLERKQKKVT